ncbi:MAG: right-handed parallel beta-helix repeat-containing protein [Litorimonas sp.]
MTLPLLAASCATGADVGATDADFYVATDGNDAADGKTLRTAFATLERARDAVRDFKGSTAQDHIRVLIRGGRYQLNYTVLFDLNDSIEGDRTITYAAYPGEIPLFSAGTQIRGWTKAPYDLPDLPEAARGNVLVANVSGDFKTLYDADGRLTRASGEPFIPTKKGKSDVIHFPQGAIKDWDNLDDVEVFVRPHHAWIVNVLPLKSVDTKKQIATTKIKATYGISPLHFLKDVKNCFVENVIEGLDAPGKWVLNSKTGKLYLWPRNESAIYAPQLRELVKVQGDINKMGPVDVPVTNLHFIGLSFMHGERPTPADNDAGVQHDWEMYDKDHAMVRFRGTENCSIKDCHFAHSGGGALRLDLHAMNNEISGNHIEEIGTTGIFLCGYGPGTKDVNKDNLVYNNHIHHTGRILSHGSGILVWQSGNNKVANNLIHNTPYTGLIISGVMSAFFAKKNDRELVRTVRWHEVKGEAGQMSRKDTEPYLHTRDNVFEYNEIHHAMEALGDGNAIYIRGAGPGNIIRRNYVHHLVAPMIMQAAIRTDGGQRDTLITENIVYKCTSQGILLKLNNEATNNIIADIIAPPRGYYMSLREGPLTGANISKNIFYASGDECVFVDVLPPRREGLSEDRRGRALARTQDADMDQNIYYCAGKPELGPAWITKQQAVGVDQNSLAANPMFVDPENGDFRFAANSPAHKMGIKPIDMSAIGLRT